MARAEPEGTLTPADQTSSIGDWCEKWRAMLFIGPLDELDQMRAIRDPSSSERWWSRSFRATGPSAERSRRQREAHRCRGPWQPRHKQKRDEPVVLIRESTRTRRERLSAAARIPSLTAQGG